VKSVFHSAKQGEALPHPIIQQIIDSKTVTGFLIISR